MITKLHVDGFKSLRDFDLKFSTGPNVLIGPNGVGKSNICQAVAMLGAVANDELVEYILALGGSKNVFTNDSSESPSASRQFKIGCEGRTTVDVKEGKVTELKYNYGLTVCVADHLEILGENLTISRRTDKGNYRVALSVRRNQDNIVTIRYAADEKFAGPVKGLVKSSDGKPFKIDYENSRTVSFLDLFSQFVFFIHIVESDLKKLKVFNIDPHIAKKPSDILEPSGMLSDGKRLSNAIYELHKRDSKSLELLNAFMKNIMPRYARLNSEVSEDTLTRSFSITDIDDRKFPARSLSDGTVKAIAFMVGMAECETGSIVIEEPENYLHPWAVNSLIEFIRDVFDDRSCIVTTHSETLLNSIHPSEIVVCTNESGYTVAKRIKETRNLELAIEDSGFGCGYHYLSGALGGTPL